jgi:hypothetical protein
MREEDGTVDQCLTSPLSSQEKITEGERGERGRDH